MEEEKEHTHIYIESCASFCLGSIATNEYTLSATDVLRDKKMHVIMSQQINIGTYFIVCML